MRVSLGLTVLCLASLVAGCGGTDQLEVQGTVSYDGQPVKAGAIAFVPAANQGLSAGGTVLDGKYHIPAHIGPKTGAYRVEIRWAKPTGKKIKSETGATLELTEEGLPAKYNDQSELTAELKPGSNTVNFDLKR
jgi:hypothetical protein